jgi:hypothetical protein
LRFTPLEPGTPDDEVEVVGPAFSPEISASRSEIGIVTRIAAEKLSREDEKPRGGDGLVGYRQAMSCAEGIMKIKSCVVALRSQT